MLTHWLPLKCQPRTLSKSFKILQGSQTGPNPSPAPIPRPNAGPGAIPDLNPSPGPIPGPNPSHGPIPGPNPRPCQIPGANPGPGPIPGPSPIPGVNPSPSPIPGANAIPGPIQGPNPGPSSIPSPNPGLRPIPSPNQGPGSNPGPNANCKFAFNYSFLSSTWPPITRRGTVHSGFVHLKTAVSNRIGILASRVPKAPRAHPNVKLTPSRDPSDAESEFSKEPKMTAFQKHKN